MQKIITHLPPFHFDDFMAVSLLKYRYPDATIERVHPQNLSHEDNAIYVDTGGKYDGERYFDHHHDLNLNSSIVLVLKRFYLNVDCSRLKD